MSVLIRLQLLLIAAATSARDTRRSLVYSSNLVQQKVSIPNPKNVFMSYLPVIIENGNHLAPVSSKTLLASLSENGQRFLALCSVDPKSMDCFDVAGHGQQ
jgi:hypothetical protein